MLWVDLVALGSFPMGGWLAEAFGALSFEIHP